MITIEIPPTQKVQLRHLVLDYNGTIAHNGHLIASITPLLKQLSEQLKVYVITADTFGTVEAEVADLGVRVKVLESGDHTQEKADFIDALGSKHCIAIGNGNNDAKMLQTAILSMAVIGSEGCALQTLQCADLVVNRIDDALEMILNSKALIATLRR